MVVPRTQSRHLTRQSTIPGSSHKQLARDTVLTSALLGLLTCSYYSRPTRRAKSRCTVQHRTTSQKAAPTHRHTRADLRRLIREISPRVQRRPVPRSDLPGLLRRLESCELLNIGTTTGAQALAHYRFLVSHIHSCSLARFRLINQSWRDELRLPTRHALQARRSRAMGSEPACQHRHDCRQRVASAWSSEPDAP